MLEFCLLFGSAYLGCLLPVVCLVLYLIYCVLCLLLVVTEVDYFCIGFSLHLRVAYVTWVL